MRRVLPLVLLAFFVPHPGSAAEGLSPTEAAELVAAAMHKAGIAGAEPVPPSRALPGCDGAVSVSPDQGGWSTARLSCDAPRWTRVLRSRNAPTGSAPRAAGKDAPAVAQVLGLVRPLGKGAVIGPADLGPVPVSAAAPDQTYTKPEDLVGRSLRQALGPGKPVLPRHLTPSYLVSAGSTVLILSSVGGISVASQGRAEADAALGETVPVINLSSGRRIDARVQGKDIVAVTLKPQTTLP